MMTECWSFRILKVALILGSCGGIPLFGAAAQISQACPMRPVIAAHSARSAPYTGHL